MPKLLKIGAALNCGAPGRISEQIGLLAKSKRWDVYMAHGLRYANSTQLKEIAVSTEVEEYFHALQSVLFDGHGLGSKRATERFIKQVQQIRPDIIHLHNLHGYFLNFKILFEYLATTDIPIVWTLHDCWPFTGHCAYFDSVDCQKWKTECYQCPLKRDYPKSLFFDRSRKNYKLKKSLFSNLKNVTMVPVSDWLGNITKESFMGKYPVQVIHNGIDLNVFRPIDTNLRQRLRISEDKIVVLGLASPWIPRKGYCDMIQLSKHGEFQVIMVGISKKQMESLPKAIIPVERTSNQHELVEYYNIADVFVNPTYSDNFPTTNLEALACGTPVITYDTGGSPEAIDEHTGIVIPQGDLSSLVECIKNMKSNPLSSDDCRKRAVAYFNKDDRYREYLNLYNELIAK